MAPWSPLVGRLRVLHLYETSCATKCMDIWLGWPSTLLYQRGLDILSFFFYFLPIFLSSHLFRLIILFVPISSLLLTHHRFGKRCVESKLAEKQSPFPLERCSVASSLRS